MVFAALVHFILVELRPLIAAGMSSLSICGTMVQASYNHLSQCVCNDGCTQQETFEQNAFLLQAARMSLKPEFYGETECMWVAFESEIFYVTVFYNVLLWSWVLVLLMGIIMFLVEAFKQPFTSVQSGAYLVFTLQLEERCIYKVVVRTYVVSWCVLFLTGLLVILLQSNMDWHIVQVIFQNETIPIVLLLCSAEELLSPVNLEEFSAWNLEKLRKISFRRSYYSMLFGSNDELYLEIGVATMQAARGNFSHLRRIVLRDHDAHELMLAINLPSDWYSSMPPENDSDQPKTVSEDPGPSPKTVNESIVEVDQDGQSTRYTL
eukprot:Skav201268  [mRNA]  locus=scaffold1810:58911:60567:+ [translate_table: standard]